MSLAPSISSIASTPTLCACTTSIGSRAEEVEGWTNATRADPLGGPALFTPLAVVIRRSGLLVLAGDPAELLVRVLAEKGDGGDADDGDQGDEQGVLNQSRTTLAAAEQGAQVGGEVVLPVGHEVHQSLLFGCPFLGALLLM